MTALTDMPDLRIWTAEPFFKTRKRTGVAVDVPYPAGRRAMGNEIYLVRGKKHKTDKPTKNGYLETDARFSIRRSDTQMTDIQTLNRK